MEKQTIMLSTQEIKWLGEALALYEPLDDVQRDFHKSQADVRWLFGGNQSGKTNTGMMDLAQLVLDIHPFRSIPKGLHWVAIESWEQVRDILWEEKLKKFIPPWHIRNISYGQDKVPRKVFLKNGHVIEFKAFNQGRELFQGRAIDSCHCDEQCHRDFQGIFNEIQARLMAKSGFLSWSMTPIMPQVILEERIEELPDTDEIFYADLNSNRESKGGYIPDKRIDNLISEWPEEVQATRVKGHFASFYGAVYKTFNRSIHVIKPFEIPKEWTKYRGFDFGFCNPFACLWIAKDKDENWYIYREYYKAKTGIGEHIANVKKLSMAEDYVVSWADPENAEDRAEMRKAGISTKPARKDISRGIELIQSKLKVKPNGKPSLFIFNSCRNTCREIVGYHYPTGSKSKNPADKPVQKNDHTCFIAGTLVQTDEGEKPIERIRVGDKVLTRQGYNLVIAAGMTDNNADVITAVFSDGTKLTGTRKHPVFVKGKGFIPLSDLRYGDIIQICKLTGVLNFADTQNHPPEEIITDVVPVFVVSVSGVPKCAPVYNLTIVSIHEYYANGILVKNCDALRYVIYSTERPRKKGSIYVAA